MRGGEGKALHPTIIVFWEIKYIYYRYEYDIYIYIGC